MIPAQTIFNTYLHLQDDGKTNAIPVSDSFWEEIMSSALPQLDRGRLMSAFSFSEPWSTWERHPAGDELVMLLSGAATLILEQADKERAVKLSDPGAFVLVPQNIWHTARTTVPTTMLFVTQGAGTEHRPATQ